MKWPSSLTLIRHGESVFNELQKKRNQHPLWKEFLVEFKKDYHSFRTKELAEELLKLFPFPSLFTAANRNLVRMGDLCLRRIT